MSALRKASLAVSKRMGSCLTDYRMIDDGDRLMVAVSGGKDSLTLLSILNERRTFVPVKYGLLAAHIDFGFHRSASVRLARFCKKLGVEYVHLRLDALKKTPPEKINCFWCSWNRRKALFELAQRLKVRKICFGHHKDDIIETTLLNMFFHGEISTMCPRQELFKGKIVILRPLAYVEESLIEQCARQMKLPVDACRCPHADFSNRTAVRRIISRVKHFCPDVKTNIFRSTSRIKTAYLGGAPLAGAGDETD